MTFASICTGIGGFDMALERAGMTNLWMCEIDRQCREVLRFHYPNATIYEDMLKLGSVARPDVLCGGCPCQAFSVAGLRKGLADPRGNLTIQFLALIDRLAPAIVIYENVPGLLSADEGQAFGSFLGGLAELRYGFAYRVLDAQYFGLAQRRKRVFVVACAGGAWQRAASILFDRESLCGNNPPSREAGKGIAPSVTAGPPFSRTGNERTECEALVQELAPSIPARTRAGGGLGTDAECDGALIPELASTLRSGGSNPASHAARAGDKDETLLPEIADCLQERDSKGSDSSTKNGHLIPVNVKHEPIHINMQAAGGDSAPCVAGPLMSDGKRLPGCQPDDAESLQVIGFQSSQSGVREVETHATLDANNGSRRGNGVLSHMAVRRLTPTECERLQGFPDGWTEKAVSEKTGKIYNQADGPRYRQLGNAVPPPVVEWIARRIVLVKC